MNISIEYKLSKYRDYGMLGEKECVRLVRDEEKGRMCVKKILPKELMHIIQFRINNPSIYFPVIYECFEQENDLIIIEEYIEGVTLEQFMMGEALPEDKAVAYATQICSALMTLHNAKPMIVYRDLKPENVMITSDEKIKLIDFNISREYEEGKSKDTMLLGTAGYAAPEQFGFFQTDNRTDIYAFGIVFNCMLTGEISSEHITEGKYQGLIEKCIEFEPQKRFQKMEDVYQAIDKPRKSYKYVDKKSWAIPGFRSRKVWKMLVAIMGYIALIEFARNGSEGDSVIERSIMFVFVYIAGLSTIFVMFNYRGITDNNKYLKNTFIRVLGSLLVGFCVMYIYFMLEDSIHFLVHKIF